MEKKLIDDCFYVEQSVWKTWRSYDKEGNPLVTSLTEDACVSASRYYCKGLQEGFGEDSKSYKGFVEGKL